MASVRNNKGHVIGVSRLWRCSNERFRWYRRSFIALTAIVIVGFVVLFLAFSRTAQTVLPVRKSAKEGGVGFVESEVSKKAQRVLTVGKSAKEYDVVEPEVRAKQSELSGLPEKHHIVYVRIPKTGSSTTMVLMLRYALTRNLSVLAVRPLYQYTRPRLTSKEFFLPAPGEKSDISINHVFYDKENYAPYFHNDTFYCAQLREPMSMLFSSVYYFKTLMRAIPGDVKDKVRNYLQHPERYDGISPSEGWSFTKNPQSLYLGLQKHDFASILKIREFIQIVEKDFPLVMILEKYDESLILFRRMTNWPVKDLIYNVLNPTKEKPNLRVSSSERQIYRNWSLADHLLYDYFSEKLEKQVAEAGPTFQMELELFKKHRSEAAHYCRYDTITDNVLSIPATPYHGGFTISRADCVLMQMEGPIIISAIRKRQNLWPYLSVE